MLNLKFIEAEQVNLAPADRLPEKYACSIEHEGHTLIGRVCAGLDEDNGEEATLHAIVYLEREQETGTTITSVLDKSITKTQAKVRDLHRLMRSVSIFTCSECGHIFPATTSPMGRDPSICGSCYQTKQSALVERVLLAELETLATNESEAVRALQKGGTVTVLVRLTDEITEADMPAIYGEQPSAELAMYSYMETIAFSPSIVPLGDVLAFFAAKEITFVGKPLQLRTEAFLQITRQRLACIRDLIGAIDGTPLGAARHLVQEMHQVRNRARHGLQDIVATVH